jgi:hypothetical protein
MGTCGEKYMEKGYVKNYKEIRGTVNRKGVNILKKYYFVVSDGRNQTRVYVGKELYEGYSVGEQVTIGYIEKKLINIRKGICGDEK